MNVTETCQSVSNCTDVEESDPQLVPYVILGVQSQSTIFYIVGRWWNICDVEHNRSLAFNLFFIRYFLYLHFKCYPLS